MNIYVGNLSYSMTEEELRGVFAKFGEVTNVNIIIDRQTNRSKGFGFIDMPNDSEAAEAMKSLDNTTVGGRNIKVNKARPKRERPPRNPKGL